MAAADRLCATCVALLDVDAATLSLVFSGDNSGTFGASDAPARTYDEVQFTLGEGPCLDSVANRCIVAVPELSGEPRWQAYTRTMLGHDIHSVCAIPVVLGGQHVGALNVYRHRAGPLRKNEMIAALMAAELAEMPLLDLLSAELATGWSDPDSGLWAELGALTRTEVNQATGMLVAQLGVEPAEALARLRAHAYATGSSAIDTARAILARDVRLDLDR